MWLPYEEFDDFALAFSASIGRALTLAQSFEDNCKYVLLIANLSKEIEKKRIADLEGIQSYSERLHELFKLGNAVNEFKTKHKVKPESIEILRKGKNARNYIAHESAHSLLHGSEAANAIWKNLSKYRNQVLSLAVAENLIAQWSYEIQEKSAAPYSLMSEFPEAAAGWVMEPLTEALPSHG